MNPVPIADLSLLGQAAAQPVYKYLELYPEIKLHDFPRYHSNINIRNFL